MATPQNVLRGFRLRELDKGQSLSNMLPTLSVTLDQSSLDVFKRQLNAISGGIEMVMQQAVEKTRIFMRREIIKDLGEETTLTKPYIAKGVRSKKAHISNGHFLAEIRVASKRLPLGRYLVNPQSPPVLKGIPISARMRTTYKVRQNGNTYGDRPYKQDYANSNMSALFTQKMNSGHVGSFYRVKSTKALIQQYGPNVQFFLGNPELQNNLEQKGNARLLQEIQKQSHNLLRVRPL